MQKVLLNIAGGACVALGVLGIFLPLLPTTPFLLLASACYLRSSERSYRWLMSNRYLGAYIKGIKEERAMPVSAKIVTVGVLWASLIFSIYKIDQMFIDFLLIGVGICTSTMIFRMKTLKKGL
jgi:uncharacterized membrane protein YbaN (DUF454 family)